MYVLTTSDMRSGYVELLDAVMQFGDRTSPRGEPTIELSDVLIELTDPTRAIPYGIGRKLHMPIASAEFIQLIGGYSDVKQLASISPTFTKFTDGGRLRGAYGPRLFPQWMHVINRLTEDHDTRQAVATIWRPNDLKQSSKDVPCTISLRYSIRNGALHACTHMRSNDLWLGTPYDFGQFTALQRTLAFVLQLEVGTYTHFVNSLHLYEHDVEASHAVKFGLTNNVRDFMPPIKFTSSEQMDARSRWILTQALARRIGYGQALESERNEHFDRLEHHASTRAICRACRYAFDDDPIGDKLCEECQPGPDDV